MITDETVERVRQAADIVQIIGEHVTLKRSGTDFRGPCPFHQGTHRNFSVSPRKGIYYCFVCHEGGDVFTFLQKRLGLDWPGAVRYVAEKTGIPVEEVQRRRDGPDPRQPVWDVNSAVADYFRRLLWDEEEGRAARDYLALRRVSRDVADRFGLGFAPREPEILRTHFNALGFDDERLLEAGLLVRREESHELRPRFRNRLIFPILDAVGNTVGFGGRLLGPGEPKYLNSADSPVFSKTKLLYGFHMAKHIIRRDDRVLVVEGYFDVVRLVSAGFDWVVAPLGTALTEAQGALLRRFTKNAYLLYDSDRAGLKATFRAGDELLRHGMSVQVVTLPEGEDPDSFVDRFGGEQLTVQLAQAIDVFERKVQLLERSGWFADLRRKRRAIDRMLPTIRAASDAMTREIYLARASEVSGVSREVLYAELGDARDPGGRDTAGWASGSNDGAGDRGRERAGDRAADRSGAELARGPRRARGLAARGAGGASAEPRIGPVPERNLLWVLVHDRSDIELVAERLGPEDLTDAVAREIFTALTSAAGKPASEIQDALSDAAAPVFARLLEDRIGEGFDRKRWIEGCVSQILRSATDARMREIDGEIRLGSPEEQDALLREKRSLANDGRALDPGRFKIF